MSSAETQAEEEEEVVAAVAAGVLPARAAVFRRVSRAPRLLLALRDLPEPAPAADIVNIFNVSAVCNAVLPPADHSTDLFVSGTPRRCLDVL